MWKTGFLLFLISLKLEYNSDTKAAEWNSFAAHDYIIRIDTNHPESKHICIKLEFHALCEIIINSDAPMDVM